MRIRLGGERGRIAKFVLGFIAKFPIRGIIKSHWASLPSQSPRGLLDKGQTCIRETTSSIFLSITIL